MDEKQIAVKMYSKGYRYIIHPPEDADCDPIYTKTPEQIGPMLRCMWPGARPNVQPINDYLK